MPQQGGVVLGHLTAPGVPQRDVALRGGSLFAGADQVSPERLATWDRAGHFAWASPNMHDVFYGQHPKLADNPTPSTPAESSPEAPPPDGRTTVVWLHRSLAAASIVLALLLGLLLGLRGLLGVLLWGGQDGIAAVSLAGGIVSVAAFLCGWLMMGQAAKRGAPRTSAITPLVFAAIVIASIVVSSPPASRTPTFLSFAVPVLLAAVAMCTGALVAGVKVSSARSMTSRLVPIGLTLVVAMFSSAVAAANMPSGSVQLWGGFYYGRMAPTNNSASRAQDYFGQEAEKALPGWKVEQFLSEDGDSACVLGSPSAPTVHLVLSQTGTEESALEAFSGRAVTIAAFAQAFARKHPQNQWAVVPVRSSPQYTSASADAPALALMSVSYMPLADLVGATDTGPVTGSGGEQWFLSGTGNSVMGVTTDDPRLHAILEQSAPSDSAPSRAYPVYPQGGGYTPSYPQGSGYSPGQ